MKTKMYIAEKHQLIRPLMLSIPIIIKWWRAFLHNSPSEAFRIGANYQAKLTRYERQILQKLQNFLETRKRFRTYQSELGICKQDSLYEVGRAFDVFTLTSQLIIRDDGEIFSCDLTPHGKSRKIFTHRAPLNTISVITPFNHPLNTVAHKIAPAIATNNYAM